MEAFDVFAYERGAIIGWFIGVLLALVAGYAVARFEQWRSRRAKPTCTGRSDERTP